MALGPWPGPSRFCPSSYSLWQADANRMSPYSWWQVDANGMSPYSWWQTDANGMYRHGVRPLLHAGSQCSHGAASEALTAEQWPPSWFAAVFSFSLFGFTLVDNFFPFGC